MRIPGKPANESERLKKLNDYSILDSDPEAGFDDLVKVAAYIFDAPIALVSLVDEGRQWFKARLGLDAKETSRNVAFCAHAVESGEMLVVEDTSKDNRFADNPLVTGSPNVSFYAGAPLESENFTLGTLCVLDSKPRTPNREQLEALQALSRQVVAQMELRAELLRQREEADAMARVIAERERVEKLKNEFVSTVSHELRTPLTSIRGSLGLLLSGAVGSVSSDGKPLLKIAVDNTDRLVRLINDMLDVDKIESGRLSLREVRTDLARIVNEAIHENQTYAEQHGVRFVGDDWPEAWVYADTDRLRQIMDNLLSNAAKYAEGTGDVTVSLDEVEDDWVVSVTDRGPGIPLEFQDDIFSRFAQADSGNTRTTKGTGLGLAICKALIEMHGGQISFTSSERGTTFRFSLKKLQPVVMAEHPSSAFHALVVEDDEDIANLLRLMLKEHGVTCDIAMTAHDGWTLFAGGNYDLVTLDLRLPDGDGSKLYQRINSAKGAAVPVIIISGQASEHKQSLEGTAVTIIEWINKPIDLERLARSLRSALRTEKKLTVLHVEDDNGLLQVTAAQLDGIANVTAAGSLAEAQSLMGENQYDCIVLDLGLPDGNGRRLLYQMQNSKDPTPIIVYSGEDADDIRELAAGVLVKGRHDERELSDLVERMVKRILRVASSA